MCGDPILEKASQHHLGSVSTSAAECTSECCSAGGSTYFSLNAIGSRFACLHQVKLCLTTREDAMHFNSHCPALSSARHPSRVSALAPLLASDPHKFTDHISRYRMDQSKENLFTAYTPSAFSNSLICPPNRLLCAKKKKKKNGMNLDLEGITGCCWICMLQYY